MNNAITRASEGDVIPQQVASDQRLIDLRIHGRPATTQRAYRADAGRFVWFLNKSLHVVTLGDLQAFADHLCSSALRPATRNRILSAVKSLFEFGHRIGYLAFDVARPLRLPAVRDKLSERILSEAEVQRMLTLERHLRNRAILYLLYASGIRVSECCSLRWRDLQERAEGGQVTVCGKVAKTHSIRLPASIWSSGQRSPRSAAKRVRKKSVAMHPSSAAAREDHCTHLRCCGS